MKAKVIATFKAPDGSYIGPDQEVELDRERFKYLEGAKCVVKAEAKSEPKAEKEEKPKASPGRPKKSQE